MKKTVGILTAIFGILMILGGISCMKNPVATFSALSWFIGFIVIMIGVAKIAQYAAGHEIRSIWNLISGILSVVVGCLMAGNMYGHIATSIVLTSFIAAWMVVRGVDTIYEAIQIKSLNACLPDECRSAFWLLHMILGIMTCILGIFCVINPMISVVSASIIMGVSILIAGIHAILISVLIFRTHIEVETYTL